MTQISTVRKLLIGCGAIATTAFGSLVQSASAAEQFNNQTVQFDRDTIIRAKKLKFNNGIPIELNGLIIELFRSTGGLD